MLQYCTGNPWVRSFDIRICTVNCAGIMGKGIAKEFAERYPAMLQDYKWLCKSNLLFPGRLHMYRTSSPERRFNCNRTVLIINFATKGDWRQPSQLAWIEDGLIELRSFLQNDGVVRGDGQTVALPALGCGNGGLNWQQVAGMITKHLGGIRSRIDVFNPAKGPFYDAVIP